MNKHKHKQKHTLNIHTIELLHRLVCRIEKTISAFKMYVVI